MANITQTITANGANGHGHKFSLIVEEVATDAIANTSTLSVKFQLSGAATSWPWSGWTVWYSIIINDEVVSTSSFNKYGTYEGTQWTPSPLVLYDNNITIEHDSDGTKTVALTFGVDDTSTVTYTCGDCNASGSMVLSNLDSTTHYDIKLNDNTYWDSSSVLVRDGALNLEQLIEPVLLWPATESTAKITSLAQNATLTLNTGWSQFTLIYIEFYLNSSSTELSSIVLPVPAMKKMRDGGGTPQTKISWVITGTAANRASRQLQFTADTTVKTTNANYNQSTTYQSGYMLPYRIYGIM